ncbi:MAG TPA: HD domain-containing protein [Armatimonadota bacterium]|nr:HD domain-containing protein [Armatimonadota bacterium]HOS43532.1 HD domain-containing protein [Armatimonadota bacterium]
MPSHDIHIDDVLARVPDIAALRAARDAVGLPAWVVGGTVRDLLLGRDPADVDIATRHPEPLARHLAGITGGHVVLMDAETGVWRVALPAGRCLDLCRFRACDILGDLRGRDFTFNAMALRLPEGDKPGGLLDPFHGLADLNAGLLRMVDARAFRDDPARILRAYRFISDLRLAMETDTRTAMLAVADQLAAVAPERLLREWWALCAGAHAAWALRAMSDDGVLGILLPELLDAKGLAQNAYHHLDVWEHLLLTAVEATRLLYHPEEVLEDLAPDFAPLLDDAHRRARFVCLALFHDAGKPLTRSVKNDRVHFYRHEVAGAELMGRIGTRLRMSRRDRQALTAAIRHHMRPLFLAQQVDGRGPGRKAMVKFFEETGGVWLEVLALSLADKAAARGPEADPRLRERQLALYRALVAFHRDVYQPALAHPVLTGADLLPLLPPGPHIGQVLRQARHKQLLGELPTREKALRWAERTIQHG